MHGRAWIAAAASATLASCAADSASQSSTTIASASPTATSVAPPPRTYRVVPAAEVIQARLEEFGGPDWLAADETGVWIKFDNGDVERIDPATNDDDLDIHLPDGDLCHGIGVGFGSVWSCVETDVVRIDPENGDVVATLPVDKTFTQGHIVATAGRMWVLTGDGTTLVGIDPATNDAAITADLGTRAYDLAVGDAGFWAIANADSAVVRIDPATGEVLQRIDVAERPFALAVGAEIWVGSATTTVKIDPGSGAVLATVPVGVGANGALSIADGIVWVRSRNDFVVRVDEATGNVLEGYASDVVSGGDILVAFGSVWATAFDAASVFRLDAAP